MPVITAPFDRWDIIALRVYDLPDLGWAIADANPQLAELLILPAGIVVNVPDLTTLRRPLTAANPAREDNGQFLTLPPDTPRIIPVSPVTGDFIPISAIGVTVAPLENGIVPAGRLPAYPTLASLNGVSTAALNTAIANFVTTNALNSAIANFVTTNTLTSSIANFVTTSALNSAIANFVTTSALNSAIANFVTTSALNTAIANFITTSSVISMLSNYVGITAVGQTVAPLVNNLVPVGNLPTPPTLSSLNGVSKANIDETIDGNKTFTGFTRLGDDSIKKKTVQGMTNAAQGNQVTVAHGVNSTKIRSVNGLIYYTATGFPIPNDMPSVPLPGRQAGFASNINISSTVINVINEASNSGSILNKPFIMTIEYTS